MKLVNLENRQHSGPKHILGNHYVLGSELGMGLQFYSVLNAASMFKEQGWNSRVIGASLGHRTE